MLKALTGCHLIQHATVKFIFILQNRIFLPVFKTAVGLVRLRVRYIDGCLKNDWALSLYRLTGLVEYACHVIFFIAVSSVTFCEHMYRRFSIICVFWASFVKKVMSQLMRLLHSSSSTTV
jgi:hypothetical protein